MADEHDQKHDEASTLLRSSGLTLTDEEIGRVGKLFTHYAGDRATLAAHMLGETEPATIFQALRQDERP